MKRLVCVVEGRGEVQAVPALCARILRHLEVHHWIVDPNPVRQPRSLLVDEREKSPRRRSREDTLRKAVDLARRRPADGVLVLCDADDDCPAAWGPHALGVITSLTAGAAVMTVREYETWLLLNHSDEELTRIGLTEPERKQDAKKALARLVPGYLPTTHQLAQTRTIDIDRLRTRSRSFDKLVRPDGGPGGEGVGVRGQGASSALSERRPSAGHPLRVLALPLSSPQPPQRRELSLRPPGPAPPPPRPRALPRGTALPTRGRAPGAPRSTLEHQLSLSRIPRERSRPLELRAGFLEAAELRQEVAAHAR